MLVLVLVHTHSNSVPTSYDGVCGRDRRHEPLRVGEAGLVREGTDMGVKES